MHKTILITVCIMCGLVSGGVESASADLCQAPPANPYIAALSGLPKVHTPPKTGKLPFAPAVQMVPISGTLLANGEDIGFLFPVDRMHQEKSRKPSLQVSVRVSVLNRRGQVVKVVMLKTQSVRGSETNRVGYTTPKGTHLYRVDTRFEGADGKRLGAYSQYFRSVPAKFDASITLEADTVAPGGTLVARLENLGAVWLGTGFGYSVERFDGSSWVADAALQGNRIFPRVLVRIGPAGVF